MQRFSYLIYLIQKLIKNFLLYFLAQADDDTEAIIHRCSIKKVFLEISQNSQENTY